MNSTANFVGPLSHTSFIFIFRYQGWKILGVPKHMENLGTGEALVRSHVLINN